MGDMIIDKRFRGKGIGSILIKDFLNWCKSKKVTYISATASAKNEKIINFYRKLGFKDYNLTLEKRLK